MQEKLIYLQEFEGEVISKEDSELLFGDRDNMSYKHFHETTTYADDVRVYESKGLTNTSKIGANDWANFTNKGE